jgi:puromycin-sensitive aminopeptidase
MEAGVTTITMNSKEINILEAECCGQQASGINYNKKLTTVTLVFDEALPVGAATLSMNFNGIMNKDMCGFYQSQYTNSEGEKAIMGATQFESIDARRAFPCWDEPSVKATFAVTLIIDQGLTALSNMPETITKFAKGGKKMVKFDTTPIMSTYLLAWVVGEFDYVQAFTKSGVSMRIFAPPGRADQCQFALDCGIRCLEYYDEFFQIPYPLPKMDMICITEFAAGAMENWGLVTYREVALMVDDKVASAATKQRVAIVIAHELAHQWFGNLVTMEWWNGLWLNEGFAAFCEHFGTDAIYPEYNIWEQYTTGAFRHAQMLDSMRTSHPIIVPIKNADEVEQVFDAISYCKGSTVVRMVRAVTGPEAFQKGLQEYFKKYAYSNATTAMLWDEWSAASGKDINSMMETWTTIKGYPYVKVVSEQWSDSSLTLTLEQNWFLQDGSGDSDPEAPVWNIPLFFATKAGLSSDVAQVMSDKTQTFTIALSGADDFVKINGGQVALVRAAHSVEMAKRLRSGVSSGAVGAIDRASLLLDGYALAKAGLAPVESIMELLPAYENEENNNVWDAMCSVLEGFNTLSDGTSKECNTAYRAMASKIVTKAFKKVGFDPSDDDSHSTRLLRAAVLSQVGTFLKDDAEVVAECRRRFNGYEDDITLMPADIQATILQIVLQNGGQAEYDQTMKMYMSTDDMQRKKIPLNVLGAVNDDKLKMATLEFALRSDDVKLQDFFYPIGSVTSNLKGTEMAWKFLQDNFAEFMNKVAKANSHLFDAVIQFCLVRFMSVERAAEVEAFFQANPVPRNTMRLNQMLEYIRTNAKFLDAFKASKLADPAYYQ